MIILIILTILFFGLIPLGWYMNKHTRYDGDISIVAGIIVGTFCLLFVVLVPIITLHQQTEMIYKYQETEQFIITCEEYAEAAAQQMPVEPLHAGMFDSQNLGTTASGIELMSECLTAQHAQADRLAYIKINNEYPLHYPFRRYYQKASKDLEL